MIRFACSCGKPLQVREELAGKRVACPGCGQVQVVPRAEAEVPLVEEVRPSPRSRPTAPPERPRTRPEGGQSQAEGRSGKATASLVLGLTSILCNVFTGLPAVLFGLLALLDIRRSGGRLQGKGFAVTGILLGFFWSVACIGGGTWGFIYVKKKGTEATGQAASSYDMARIMMALQAHQTATGQLPAAALCDKKGKPLLSWRVAILPHLGEDSLYRQFRQNEPWDSPHNKQLLGRMPEVYRFPGQTTIPATETVYQVFVGKGAAFDLTRGYKIPGDFSDGASNTILLIEANRSVPWTKPEDLPFDPNAPLPALGGHLSKTVAILADGRVKLLPTPLSDNQLKPLITRNGNDTVDWTGIE